MSNSIQYRILIIDDNTAIHEDFRAALQIDAVNHGIAKTKAVLFGQQSSNHSAPAVEDELSLIIDSAYQGEEAYFAVEKAFANNIFYSLAFVDIRMPPGWDGIETIQKLWEIDPDIEIVICSAHSDYSWEEMRTQLKASDNVLILKKPFELIEIRQLASTLTKKWHLKRQVKQQITSLKNMTQELERLNEELLYQATHDTLTGLPNRALLCERINQAIIDAKHFDRQVGIFLFDLDNFKEINDSLGHHAGDLLLQLIAKNISSYIKDTDTLVRLGGDEFLIILPDLAINSDLTEHANSILSSLSTTYKIEHHDLIVTASMGISIYPKDGNDYETLFKNADSALYYAKESGRNSYQFYNSTFNELILKRLELTTALRLALEKKQLFLCYQPLLEVDSDAIVGIEALLRWEHPTFGVIAPDVFIPLAEETGLIQSIGEWVLKSACTQAKIWQNAGINDLKIAVNISAKQFQNKAFVNLVQTVLQDTQLEPKYLELELTESIILNNFEDALAKMNTLKSIGVCLVIDDFGTGYSSLSYLKYFSFDKIKIDKRFIEGVGKNNNDNTIVKAIIIIAKQLGIKVLAEGVENKEQMRFISAHQGEQVQGYYFSRPLDVMSCTHLLKENQAAKKMTTTE